MQDEKACFSKLDSYLPNDYSVNFSDMQTLQRLRSKVLQTARILESCLSLATRLKKHCCSMNSTHNFTSKENVISSIETYAADIKVYQQNIAETEESLKGTFGLVRTFLPTQLSKCNPLKSWPLAIQGH